MFMLGAADDGRMEKAFSAGSATYSAYLRQNAVKSVLSSAASAGPSKATRKYSGAGSGSFPPLVVGTGRRIESCAEERCVE